MQAGRILYSTLLLGIVGFVLSVSVCVAADKQGEEKKDWRHDPYATQLDMNEGAAADYNKADQELNRVYKQILSKHKANKIFIDKFIKAEQAWVAFRDAQLAARFPLPRENYGSMYLMCKYIELTILTNDRIKQLKPWIAGVKEGDGCTGSYPVNR
ncbi:MAG TPA: lysozyme inhibitor LprI family protein [Candidatus Obscuribacterales bacterium]